MLGPHRVGDGGEDHGDVLVLGGGVAGGGGGGGDAHHHGGVLGGEGLANLDGHVVVKAGVLVVDGVVGALFQPRFLQALEETLPAVVQGGVLAVLADADDGGLALCLSAAVPFGGGAASYGSSLTSYILPNSFTAPIPGPVS